MIMLTFIRYLEYKLKHKDKQQNTEQL